MDSSDNVCTRKRRKVEQSKPAAETTLPATGIAGPSLPVSVNCEHFLKLETQLNEQLKTLKFSSPVSCIYYPLDYAFHTHSQYVKRHCTTGKDLLFVGMNPGPFGMVQTGVPFGEVILVKEWLKIEGPVGKPHQEHPQRPVLGFGCTRREVSGQRFWNFFKTLAGTPDRFFRHAFVYNYCPVVFMNSTGKNITPPSLPVSERKLLEQLCDAHIQEVVKLLKVKIIIAIGKYTYDRLKLIAQEGVLDIKIEFLMHPSPINPTANKGWDNIARKKLEELNVLHYFS